MKGINTVFLLFSRYNLRVCRLPTYSVVCYKHPLLFLAMTLQLKSSCKIVLQGQ